MESEAEARRLAEQARAMPVHAHLLSTGLAPGMKALDAGCGPGVITSAIAEVVGRQGSVLGVDIHPQRLADARTYCASLPQCSFLQADVCQLDRAGDTFDYVWCQYVFEYLPDPAKALDELIRVTRPGGRVVVSDMDGLGMLNWPFPPDLEEGCRKFGAAAAAAGVDMHVGRKMFHLFRRAGLENIRVHLAPTWIVAGAADARLLSDWKQRFATLAPVAAPAFGGKEAYDAFCERYLGLLSDPDALKYSVLLITEGQKH
jgi:SAM-dependent methyltransferase